MTYNDVKLTMTDEITGKKIIRTIDITNAMISGPFTWELGDKKSQRKKLENWIAERGNEQHETILNLDSWELTK